MTAIPAVGAVKVWILPAVALGSLPQGRSGYSFPWSSSFVECKRLIPTGQGSVLPGGMGTAQFRLLRQVHLEPASSTPTSGTDNVVPGAYVAISIGASSFRYDSCVWWGWITSVSYSQLAGADDQAGSVSAQGVGALLDGTQIQGFKRVKSEAATSAADVQTGFPVDIGNPPTMNLSIADGEVIGNAHILLGSDDTVNVLSPELYGFASKASDCGKAYSQLWTRWRALCHVIKFCRPAGIPKILIDAPATVIAELIDAQTPEVFDVSGLTLKGAIDLIIPRSRGYGWKLTPKDGVSWTLVIYSHDFNGEFGPANQPTSINISSLSVKSVNYTESAGDIYEEIVIRGSPIVSCATFSFADDNLERGWTQDQEDDFLTAASDDPDYDSVDTDTQKERNRAVRNNPYLSDVFRRFVFKSKSNDGIVYGSDNPANNGHDIAAVPEVYWDGANLTALTFAARSRFPNMPGTKILRVIPWPVGVKTDGTDTRNAKEQARPAYIEPRLFRKPTDYGETQDDWVDLLAAGGEGSEKERGTPDITSDDRFGGVVVKYHPPEMIAKNHWDTGAGESDLDPDDDTKDRALDYEDLVITAAVESDQFLEVRRRKPGISDGIDGDPFVRRRLTVDLPQLKCWLMVNGTILAVAKDGTPDAVVVSSTANIAADTSGSCFVTRNDYPTATKFADMVASWAFERRQSMSISLAMSETIPAWASIGFMIGSVVDTFAVLCNTVVESLSFDFNLSSPSVSVTTTLPQMPSFRGSHVGSSPTSGGSVSAALGGTLAQTIAKHESKLLDLQRDTQKIPIITGRGGSAGAPTIITLKILDGQTVYSAGGTTYYGVNRSGTLITTVPTLYDPNGVGGTAGLFTAATGIGRCQVYFDGVLQSGYFLCVHDTRSGFSYSTIQNDPIVAGSLVSIPDVAATGFIQAYTFSFP